jgi:uncharacterized protein YrrD
VDIELKEMDKMTTSETTTKTELDLNIGATVSCNDGRCGKLTHVALEPRTGRVTDLIVAKGFLQKKDRVIPVSAVKSASGDEIVVDVDAEDFEKFPEFDEKMVSLPAGGYRNKRYQQKEVVYVMNRYRPVFITEPVVPTVEHEIHEGVPSDYQVLDAGTPVRNALGEIGELDHLLVNSETDRISHIVIETKGLFSDYPVVPIEDVEAVDEQGIYLKMTKEELAEYPRYSTS